MMGKPSPPSDLPGQEDDDSPSSPNPTPTTVRESASAISLHTTTSDPPITRYFDDDPTEFSANDLPPLYTDHDASGRDSFADRQRIDPLLPPSARGLQLKPFRRDKATETTYYVDGRLGTDPAYLEEQLTKLSHIPPRPFVHIRGTHSERVKKGDRHVRNQVVDFDVWIELTHLLYQDVRSHRSWRAVATVGNFEKVRRGTVFATRAPGFGGSGVAEEGQPGVGAWCHRFCASHHGLKNFVFERRVTGWDDEHVQQKLESLVRSTNYRGHLSVSFPVRNARVEIYNDCRTNRWRLTKWIEVLFVFTLMFLVAWPWIFFRTRRWETVYAVWPASRVEATPDGGSRKQYAAGLSEDHWYNMWARAIHKAVIDRRQGTLDQGDLQRAEGAPDRQAGFAGAVQEGMQAMGVMNRSFGWGSDG